MPAKIDNHMLVGNRDAADLKCPGCGSLWSSPEVTDVSWCLSHDVLAVCDGCQDKGICRGKATAYECECGVFFNEEGKL